MGPMMAAAPVTYDWPDRPCRRGLAPGEIGPVRYPYVGLLAATRRSGALGPPAALLAAAAVAAWWRQ